MVEPFKPMWWCRGPHWQTLWPHLLRRGPRPVLRRERLELADGDFVDLDWTQHTHGPIVILLHGLEGSSRSHYARGLLTAVQQQDWRGVLFHFRGCGGVPNRLPRSYHSGDTADVDYFISTLRHREPDIPIAVIGVSLGGNVLLKWLGEYGRRAPITAAVAVSVPFVLHIAASKLNTGFSRLYQLKLLHSLRRSLKQKSKLMQLPITTDGKKLHTFRDFDDAVTAPLHGFHSADHYYAVSSSRQYLKSIQRPTLIIHSRDDPFVTPEVIPHRDELSNTVELEIYSHGGHVGFVSGRWPWAAEYWLENRIVDYLREHFTNR